MSGFLGRWEIDDLLTFTVNTQVFSTGVATDADSAPAYRIYEDETTTPILTGTMALLDGANTAGFYSEQITLSAANGFEVGKCYNIYISATVSGVVGATSRNFQVEAAPATAAAIGVAGAGLTAVPFNQAWLSDIRVALSFFEGTADSGTTTTLVDASTIGAGNDAYKGALITFVSGLAVYGQSRVVTAFNSATGAFTFAPALTAAVTTETYQLRPWSPDANLTGINSDTTAAGNLAKTTRAIGRGTSTTGGTTTSIPTSAFTPNGAVADQFKGRIITFDADTTTAALRGQSTDITASTNAAAPVLTVTALTTAPAAGDSFSVT